MTQYPPPPVLNYGPPQQGPPQGQYRPCPKCGSTYAKKSGFTWWGGVLGPALLTHVKCLNCNTGFNGKTGRDNTTGIVIYTVVTLAIVLAIMAIGMMK